MVPLHYILVFASGAQRRSRSLISTNTYARFFLVFCFPCTDIQPFGWYSALHTFLGSNIIRCLVFSGTAVLFWVFIRFPCTDIQPFAGILQCTPFLSSDLFLSYILRAVLIGDVNFLNFLFFSRISMKKRQHYYRARGCLYFFP